MGAVLDAIDDPVSVSSQDLVEHQERDVDTGDHAWLTRDHRRGDDRVGWHRRDRRDVGTVAEVLVERAKDRGLGFLDLDVG